MNIHAALVTLIHCSGCFATAYNVQIIHIFKQTSESPLMGTFNFSFQDESLNIPSGAIVSLKDRHCPS